MAADIASLWLEFRFGVLPLMYDIQAILALIKAKANEDKVTAFKAWGVAKSNVSSVIPCSNVYGVNQMTSVIEEYKAYKYIRYGYHLRCVSAVEEQARQATEAFGNVRDLPATLWELLPMSVFIDYFVNVGSIIEATFESQENVVWTSTSSILERSVTYTTLAAVPVAPRFVVRRFAPSRYQMKLRTVKRTSAPVLVPELVCSLPGGNIQLANISAYLASLLNRRGFRPIHERTFL